MTLVFVIAYIVVSLLIVVFNSHLWFHVSDTVLIALVSSTSINVVGLMAIVLRFVFTNHHHKILDGNNK